MNLAELRVSMRGVERLEDVLTALQAYGRPNLYCGRAGGWCCSVEMHTNAQGTRFEVQSEFGIATPNSD